MKYEPYRYRNDAIFPRRGPNHKSILDFSAYHRLKAEPNPQIVKEEANAMLDHEGYRNFAVRINGDRRVTRFSKT